MRGAPPHTQALGVQLPTRRSQSSVRVSPPAPALPRPERCVNTGWGQEGLWGPGVLKTSGVKVDLCQ